MDTTTIRRSNLQTFNDIAEDYDQRRKLPWNECVTPLTKPGQHHLILDIGAGTGRQTLAIAQNGCEVVAVDFSPNMLAKLKKNAIALKLSSEISLVVSDIVALPFRDIVFDGVEIVATLHSLPSKTLRRSAIMEAYRVTRNGGRAVITVWLRNQRGFYWALLSNAFSYLARRSEFGDVWIPWSGRPRFYHLFSPAELRTVVSLPGFHVNRVEVKAFGGVVVGGLNRNIFLEALKI